MPESKREEKERPLLGTRAPPALASGEFLPEGCWPLGISLPPSLLSSSSLPPPSLAARSLCGAAGGEPRSPQLETAVPAPTPANGSHFAPPGIPELRRPALENRSRADASRRPHPAGTDLLISRTAGRREFNCCLPLFSLAVGGLFSKGTFYSLFSIFYRGRATRLGPDSAL